MKRWLGCMAVLFCLFPLVCLGAEAEESVSGQVAEATGADGLWEELPEEVTDLLEEMGVEGIHGNTLQEVDLASFLTALIPSVKKQIGKPLKAGGTALILVLLVALTGSLLGEKRSRLVDRVGTAVCSLAVMAPLTQLFLRLQAVAATLSSFLRVYVPVLAGLTAAAGSPGRATVSSAFLLGVSALLQTASEQLLLPLSGMMVALAMVTSGDASPASAFADLFFRFLKGGLTLLSVLTGSLFALQTGLSAAGDSLSMRSAKFAVSGMVPLVGGTLSEALGTVVSAASVIGSATGAVGILSLLILFVPILVELFLWSGLCRCLSFFAGSCQVPLSERLFDRLKRVIEVLLAATFLAAALTLFATALLMKAGGVS